MSNKVANKVSHDDDDAGDTNDDGEVVHIVDTVDVNLDKYKVQPIFEAEGTQYMAFPKYDYTPNNSKSSKVEDNMDKFIVRTKPIKISKGGIPTIDEAWRPTDDKCLYMWIHHDQGNEGSNELFEKLLNPLDKFHKQRINVGEGKEQTLLYTVDHKTNKKKYLDYLDYSSLVKNSTSDPKDPKNGKRVKFRFDIAFDKSKKTSDSHKFNTALYVLNADKSISEVQVNSLQDFRDNIPWNSTVQFCLHVHKLWASKTLNNERRQCSYSIKIKQILVVEKAVNQSSQLAKCVFGNFSSKAPVKQVSEEVADEAEDTQPEKVVEVDSDTEPVSKSEQVADKDESDEEVEPVLVSSKTTKKTETPVEESDDSSEEEEQVVETPKTKKSKVNEPVVETPVVDSDDTDDTDDEVVEAPVVSKGKKSVVPPTAPTAPTKKSKTVVAPEPEPESDTDSESESEKAPVKSKVVKPATKTTKKAK